MDFPSFGPPQGMQSMGVINMEDVARELGLRLRPQPQGAPPATSADLQNIKTVEVDGEVCSICQEE